MNNLIETVVDSLRFGNKGFYIITGLVMISVLAWVFVFSPEEAPDGYASAGSDTVHNTGQDAYSYFNVTDVGVLLLLVLFLWVSLLVSGISWIVELL